MSERAKKRVPTLLSFVTILYLLSSMNCFSQDDGNDDYDWDRSWFEKGNEMFAESQFDIAVACYKKHLEIYPQDVITMVSCANALQSQGNNTEALKYCKNALKVDPTYSSAYTMMAAAYRNLKKLDESIKYSKKAISLNPSDGFAYGLMGDVYRNLKQYSKAIEMIRKRISLDESSNSMNASSFAVLGQIYEELSDPTTAAICYQNALNVDSRDPSVIYNLAEIYHEDEKYDSALTLLNRIVTENLVESYGYVYARIARSCQEAGYYTQAVKYATIALEVEPDDKDVRILTVDALRHNGEYARAIDVATQTKNIDYSSLAYVYFCMGDKAQASIYSRKYIDELKKRAKSGDDVDGNMGWASIMNMDMNAGIRWTQKALKTERKSYAELNLGLAYLCSEQYAKSKETYKSALKSAKKHNLRAGIHDIECAMSLYDIETVGNEIIAMLEEEINRRN